MRKIITILDGLEIGVDDDGTVFSLPHAGVRCNGRKDNRRGKIIAPTLDRYGYLKCSFSYEGRRRTFAVHRLVAEAFVPNPEEKETVNHKNGVKTDNRAANLEWATRSEQRVHSIRLHLCDTNIEILRNCNQERAIPVAVFGRKYPSIRAAARATGKHRRTIRRWIECGLAHEI